MGASSSNADVNCRKDSAASQPRPLVEDYLLNKVWTSGFAARFALTREIPKPTINSPLSTNGKTMLSPFGNRSAAGSNLHVEYLHSGFRMVRNGGAFSVEEKCAEMGLGRLSARHCSTLGGAHIDLEVLGDGMDVGAGRPPLNVVDQGEVDGHA